jgi:hypothetical protein
MHAGNSKHIPQKLKKTRATVRPVPIDDGDGVNVRRAPKSVQWW